MASDVFGNKLVLVVLQKFCCFFQGKALCENFTENFRFHTFGNATGSKVHVNKLLVQKNCKVLCIYGAVTNNLDSGALVSKHKHACVLALVHVEAVGKSNFCRFFHKNVALAFFVGCFAKFAKNATTCVDDVAVHVQGACFRHHNATKVVCQFTSVVCRRLRLCCVEREVVGFLCGVNFVYTTVLNVVGICFGQNRAFCNCALARNCNVCIQNCANYLGVESRFILNVNNNSCALLVQNADLGNYATGCNVACNFLGE